jgi:HEAT repeat protein
MPGLQDHFNSPVQSVRLKAALTAGTYPTSEYIQILVSQCAQEKDFFVRDTLSWALMRHDRKQVLTHLVPELKSAIPQARSQALHTLSKIGDKETYSLITKDHLFDSDDVVASTAWRAASVLVPDDQKEFLVKILITQLGRGDGDIQFNLTQTLCNVGNPILEPLTHAAKSEIEKVRIHAEITLMRFRELDIEFNKRGR